MKANPCPLCGRPIADTAFVCGRCVAHVRRDLEDAAEWWEQTEVTLTRQDHVTPRPDSSRDPEPAGKGIEPPIPNEAPMPYSVSASEARSAAADALSRWAHVISDERGVDLPVEPRSTHFPKALPVPPHPIPLPQRQWCDLSDLPAAECWHCRRQATA